MKIKKLVVNIILATGILFVGSFTYENLQTTHVSHAASYNYYSKHQCTWWAYKRRVQLGKPVSNRWGNANNWYYSAKRSGYKTGHTPRRYAIMQSTAGYYGHVAIVERKYSNGKIKVSEYNYNRPLAYGTRIIGKSAAKKYNYIY